MKKFGLTLVAALAFSASVLANGVNDSTTVAKWDGTINKANENGQPFYQKRRPESS